MRESHYPFTFNHTEVYCHRDAQLQTCSIEFLRNAVLSTYETNRNPSVGRQKNSKRPRAFLLAIASGSSERKPSYTNSPLPLPGRFTTQFAAREPRRIRFVPVRSLREFAFVIGPQGTENHSGPTPAAPPSPAGQEETDQGSVSF